MKVTRIAAESLDVFKTFDRYRTPAFLDIESRDGDLSLLSELPTLGLGIVGSRHPQHRSIELLEKTVFELKQTKLIIISGFARGIDARAHELAIKYNLRTIAFLGCGIDINYPKENARLRDEIIASGGLIISSFPRDAAPLSRNFHDRNGLIAGFSKALWVVEAAAISGTLNTATWAAKMNRDLYATSCFPNDHFYQGNVKLLSQRDSHRYPIAECFFNAESLGKTWADLESESANQTAFALSSPKTQIQKWVLQIQGECGECRIQNLMNFASKNGYTLGKFYLDYEKELADGKLKQDTHGRVEAVL